MLQGKQCDSYLTDLQVSSRIHQRTVEFAYPMCTPGAQVTVPFDKLASLLRRPQVDLIRRNRELFRSAEVCSQGDCSDIILAKHFIGLDESQVALDDEMRVDTVVSMPVQPVWDEVVGA